MEKLVCLLALVSAVASAAATTDAPLVVYKPFAIQSLDELSARCHSGVADCMAKACAAPLKPFGRQPACCANGTAADVCRDTVFSPASDIDYAVQLMYDVYVPCITQHDPRCQMESLLRAVASQCQRQSDAVVAQCQRQSDASAEQIRKLESQNAKLDAHVVELISNQRVLVTASAACQNSTRDVAAHVTRVHDDCKRANQVQDIAITGAFDVAKRSSDALAQLANKANERSHETAREAMHTVETTAEKAMGHVRNISHVALAHANDWLKYICDSGVSLAGIAANATVSVFRYGVNGAVRLCMALSWPAVVAVVAAAVMLWLHRRQSRQLQQLQQQLQQAQQPFYVAAQPPVYDGRVMTRAQALRAKAVIDAIAAGSAKRAA